MTTYVLPLLATAAAFALTYVFCVRPMRSGRACHGPVAVHESITDTELSALREEAARLRRQVEAQPSEPGPVRPVRSGP